MGIAWSSPRQARWAAHRASRASPPLSSRREALKYARPLSPMEAPMRRVNVVAVAATVALGFLAGFAAPGARADRRHRVRRRAADRGRRTRSDRERDAGRGRRADRRRPAAPPTFSVPAGATRVNLAGKTVMPMIIDTHVHLSPTRDALMRDLKRRAYFGVSAALSLGTDNYELLDMRGQTIPGAARFFSAGRGHHHARAGAHRRCRTGSPPRRKAARRCRSSRRTRSTSSRSGSTRATASTRS